MTATSSKANNRVTVPPGWARTEKTIHRTFATGSFVRGVTLIEGLRDLAEAVNHHPDVILTYPAVIVTLTTHDEGQVTERDLALAWEINRLWESLS